MSAKPSDRAITADLMARLERHYIKPGQDLPGGVFVPEVGQNGSWGAGRRCDAIYVGFTSTSGRLLVGHEVKASRSDWLTELNKPGKADQWADQCHEWWLVTAPGVVADGELPAGWGLMVPGTSRTRMKVLAPARRHPDRVPSWNTVRSIFARVDTLRAQAIGDGVRKAQQKARDEQEKLVTREVERRMLAVPDAERLAGRLKALTDALGGHLVFDDGDDLGARWYRGEQTLGDLADVAALLRANATLKSAADALIRRYTSNHVETLRRALDELERAVAQVRADLGADTTEGAGAA